LKKRHVAFVVVDGVFVVVVVLVAILLLIDPR
jgi:hypothetical protein